jgi:hypothetical protein
MAAAEAHKKLAATDIQSLALRGAEDLAYKSCHFIGFIHKLSGLE